MIVELLWAVIATSPTGVVVDTLYRTPESLTCARAMAQLEKQLGDNNETSGWHASCQRRFPVVKERSPKGPRK